ncbi:MAG: fatty acid desaturase [Candidatus Sericytochromatia bacterium]|nr:fatty acid desaturase [Candidatus Sericytochromatia bacterium]
MVPDVAPTSAPAYSRSVPVAQLAGLVREFAVVRPGPGLRQVMFRAVVLAGGIALVVMGAVRREPWLFGVSVVGLALWVASAMILTHDAIHRTLTGLKWVDDFLPPLLSWPLLWPHYTYGRLHLLHHKWNSSDSRDPERIEPLPEEWDAAGTFGRWRLRHRLPIRILVEGGVGLIVEMIAHGWRLRRDDPKLLGAMLRDVVGVVLTQIFFYGTAWWVGEHVLGGRGLELVGMWALTWLVLERVVGAIMQFRGHVEHDGLWGAGETFFDTQWASCRNVRTHRLVEWYFNYLNYHSVHHAFAFVPWYALPQAHERLAARLADAGFEDFRADGYLGAAREVLGVSTRLRDTGRKT